MDREDKCPVCGKAGVTKTVTFDSHDAIDILRTLREVVDPETLRIVAQAELNR